MLDFLSKYRLFFASVMFFCLVTHGIVITAILHIVFSVIGIAAAICTGIGFINAYFINKPNLHKGG